MAAAPAAAVSDDLAASSITQVSPSASASEPARPTRAVKGSKATRNKAAGEGDSAAAASVDAGDETDGDDDESTKDVDPTPALADATTPVSTSTSPPGGSTASSSATASPATPVQAAPPPKSPATVASVPATSKPSPSAPAIKTKPKTPQKPQKKGFASFFLACLPCVSNNAHDDTPSTSNVPLPRGAPPPKPTSSGNAAASLDEKAAGASNDTTSTKDAVPVATTTPTTGTTTPSIVSPADDDTKDPAEEAGFASATAAANRGTTLTQEETEGVTSGAVMHPGQESPAKTRRRRSGKSGPESLITSVPEPGQERAAPHESESDSYEEGSDDEGSEEDEEDEEQSLIARGGVGIPIGEDGLPHPLLAELAPELKGKKCLVLDLDETLVHSSFKQMVHQADYIVPVEIENQYHNVYVIKRPGVDGFLKAMGEIYEVVIFTASLSKYADPVLDQLDIHRVVKHRLFRESCYNNKGSYVKDLSQLGRPMSECIIIDNSPASYVFHPNNAVPISSWFNDPHDTELTDLVPFLTDLERVDDVRGVLDAGLYLAQS